MPRRLKSGCTALTIGARSVLPRALPLLQGVQRVLLTFPFFESSLTYDPTSGARGSRAGRVALAKGVDVPPHGAACNVGQPAWFRLGFDPCSPPPFTAAFAASDAVLAEELAAALGVPSSARAVQPGMGVSAVLAALAGAALLLA